MNMKILEKYNRNLRLDENRFDPIESLEEMPSLLTTLMNDNVKDNECKSYREVSISVWAFSFDFED